MPPTLTRSEQEALLRASSGRRRDHLIFSLALGTSRRLAEIVGLSDLPPSDVPRSVLTRLRANGIQLPYTCRSAPYRLPPIAEIKES